VPDWVWLSKKEWQWNKKNKLVLKKWLQGVERRLNYPIFVKPANLGSSIGISKAHKREELFKAINLAVKYDRRVLIEQGIEKAMDIEVAVLGNTAVEISLPGRVISTNEFYDYEAKYIKNGSQQEIPAHLPKRVVKNIRELAERAFKLMDGSGLARVDFLVNRQGLNWNIYLNELNTMPGFTGISMYPKLWQASGLNYGRLLDNLIVLARHRYAERANLQTNFKLQNVWYL